MQRRYFERKPDSKTVTENGNFIEENISTLMNKIPWKITKSKISLPWIDKELLDSIMTIMTISKSC